MPAGRPTDYRPEYCEQVVKYMQDGAHVIEFAAHIGVAKSTVYKWAEDYSEFSDALKIANTKSTAAWLKMHRDKASGAKKEGSDVLIIQMLKNKDREFCEGETVRQEITHNLASIDYSKLTDDQILALKNATVTQIPK